MATSSSYDFSVNATELITATLRYGGIVDPNETPTTNELSNCREALNMLIKQWMVAPNMVNRGFKVWQRQRQTIDTSSLGLAQSYTLGPSQTVDMQLPVNIMSVSELDTVSNARRTISPLTWNEYEKIGNYTFNGYPDGWFFERGTTTGTLYFDKTPNDSTRDFVVLYTRPLQDIDDGTDDFEFPTEWLRALKFNLWLDVAGEFGFEPTAGAHFLAKQSLDIANSVNPEKEEHFFEPERY